MRAVRQFPYGRDGEHQIPTLCGSRTNIDTPSDPIRSPLTSEQYRGVRVLYCALNPSWLTREPPPVLWGGRALLIDTRLAVCLTSDLLRPAHWVFGLEHGLPPR